jgi:LysR family transcriptional regulator, hydrogen peroxide-inducible genes activator
MNFQQLEYIIAVDQFKNFTKAASYCNVTQATLSAMIKKLEEELDVTIFDRKTNNIITTEIGATIINDSKKIILQTNLLKEKAKKDDQSIKGRIKIGIIPTIASTLLPRIVNVVLKAYPKIHLEIAEITTNSIIRQLREGIIDVGILATPTNCSDFESELLYYESLMVYGNFEDSKKYIFPEEIKEHKIWLLEEGHCLREQFIKLCALKKKENALQNFTFEANSFDTLLNMVDAFGGLTLIPELYYHSLPESEKKHICFFSAPVPVREVSLVFYRPFAKQRIITLLSELIKGEIVPILLLDQLDRKAMEVVKI